MVLVHESEILETGPISIKRDIPGGLIKSTTLHHVPQSLKSETPENRIWIPTG